MEEATFDSNTKEVGKNKAVSEEGRGTKHGCLLPGCSPPKFILGHPACFLPRTLVLIVMNHLGLRESRFILFTLPMNANNQV